MIYHDINIIITIVSPSPEGTFCLLFHNRIIWVIILSHWFISKQIDSPFCFISTWIKWFLHALEQIHTRSRNNRVTVFAPQFWLGWFRICKHSSWFWMARTSATSLKPRRSPSQSFCPNSRSTKTPRVSRSSVLTPTFKCPTN